MNTVLYRIAQWGLAALFVYAGFLKLKDPPEFAIELENYRMLPEIWAWHAAHYVPWVEICTAVALATKPLRLGGWLLAVTLGASFTFFVSSAWLRGLDISCGCFGANGTQVGAVSAARAFAVFAVACWGMRRAMILYRVRVTARAPEADRD